MSIESLKVKAKTYNISQEYLDSKEKGRLEFVTKFPVDKISELSLDDYVLGTNKESFCYWLEFKKIEDKVILFGIGGGNASKFGLYKSKDGSYVIGSGEKKKIISGKELEEHIFSIKNTITQAIKHVSENRISEIKKMEIPFDNIILLKILSIYYPEKFITIGASNVLFDIAKDIKLKNVELDHNNLIEINYECKKAIDAIPEFKDWSYEKIGTFFWEHFDGENKKGNKKDPIQYYLVGAYWDGNEPADQTTRFLENGIWENGYDDKFKEEVNAVPVGSKIAIKAAFTKEKTKSVMAIKAIGTVLENFRDGKNLIVEWDKNFNPFEVDFSGGYWSTIKKVTNQDHINAIFHSKSNIPENNSFYQQLIMFLKQAKTDNLKTNHYVSQYQRTKVKVSFGIGGKAKIPWISFLISDNTTSKGIYPVYLYYKEVERLILAYGISETNTPKLSWNVSDKIKIKDFYQKNYSKDPFRYGASYVYKVYDVNNLPSAETLNEDLNQIIDQYHEIIHNGEEMTPEPELIIPLDFETKSFIEALDKSGLQYSNKLITRFIASLLTKPFLILTGLSGSGKTKLAQAFAQWICGDETQYRLIPVGADWTNREPLLGYPNALKPEEYVKPDSGVLDLIIQANDHPELPHFLILDEMNLSIVERYFADFLSVMESKKEIPLFPEGSVNNGVPAKLGIPQNLFIIGTVNIDETTNMFSPKVLDRANSIEFRVTSKEMQTFLNEASEVNMDALTGKGAASAKSFLNMATNQFSNPADMDNIKETLIKFFCELKKTGAEFGYRSALEILRLIHHLSVLDQSLGTNEMIDIAIMQKLLPKLHGSRRKICPVLETLGGFCLKENGNIIKDVFDKPEFDFEAPEVLYPLSLEKITRMHKGATENGFASFAEA